MPYFIKPSINLSQTEKKDAYHKAEQEIAAILQDEKEELIKMVTINCILKTNLPYFYWIGFYLVRNDRLEVGPYQGTLGCLYIDFARGVCGKAASSLETQIVPDCHILKEGDDHIACDPNSRSEIVIPVLNTEGNLIAVFDVDSTLTSSFDEIDKMYLEGIIKQHFGTK